LLRRPVQPQAAGFNPPPAHPPEETSTSARRAGRDTQVSTRLRLIRRRKLGIDISPELVKLFQPASGSSAGGNSLLLSLTRFLRGVSTRLRLIRRRKPRSPGVTPLRAAGFNPPPAHPPEETLIQQQHGQRL